MDLTIGLLFRYTTEVREIVYKNITQHTQHNDLQLYQMGALRLRLIELGSLTHYI